MADVTTNKLITLPLLSTFKTKMQEWTQAEDQSLRTELLAEIGKLTSFEVKIVAELPATGESGYIYFVPKASGAQSSTTQNVYEEYIWVTNAESVSAFEKIGDTQVDIQSIKDDVAATTAEAYVANVEVTSADAVDAEGVTKTTYTFNFKNGKGATIATKEIVVGGGYALVTAEKDGLMSKEDKVKLDSLEVVTLAEVEALFS